MKKGYPWIDKARIVAAICVIAIHISPLEHISPFADLFLTRILGRLAVPFFFIVTAYFLFQNGYPSLEKIKKTFVHLMKWYIIAIMIYIPLMIYNHYFSQKDLFINVVKDLFIDGTFYHLWYFPAVMIGLIIVLFLKTHFTSSWCLFISCCLYGLGLCGDAYYGLAIEIPFIKGILDWLFLWMDYTRNGFFFAPVFLMIGILISEQKQTFLLQINIILCLLSFVLMSIEACLLHHFSICQHDSMYILLPLTSYFLFNLLIRQKGSRSLVLKDVSLDMYIFHPLMIVVVRMLGKLIHLKAVLDNHLIQFMLVTVLTIVFSIVLERVKQYANNI